MSIASALATPSCSAQTASLMNGIRILFDTNPGTSLATAGVLPRSRASSVIAAAVSSEVARARMISTSASTGTGLKKCMPITLSGRSVTAASEPIGIDDVFEASTASGGRTVSARRKICSLTSAARCSARRMRSCRSASRGRAATLLPLAAACCTKAWTSAFHRASSLSSALRSDANSCTRPVPWAWAAPSVSRHSAGSRPMTRICSTTKRSISPAGIDLAGQLFQPRF